MKWQRDDYLTNAISLAPRLIGAVLVHRTSHGLLKGRIVECEAYGGTWNGTRDDGAHSFKGLTKRTKVIFGEGGHAYVYLIYGMYTCFNIVCGREGEEGCVLLRALEPLEGIPEMTQNRHGAKGKFLTSGPGRLTMAMEIDRSFYGMDLTGDTLWIESDPHATWEIEQTKRIGIDYATYGKDFPWRFILKGNPYVSKK